MTRENAPTQRDAPTTPDPADAAFVQPRALDGDRATRRDRRRSRPASHRRGSPSRLIAAALLAALGAAGCIKAPPPPGAVSLERRVAAFPTHDLDLRGRVEILFNDRGIPFVLAQHDHDVPYALGMLHAHFREGQMELLRRVAAGRLSETAGPLATEIDVVIRTLDLDRAVPEIERSLPPDTRAWLERYVAGLNRYIAKRPRAPLDLRLLGGDVEPWTVADVLTIGRLAGADLNWGRWYTLGRLRDEPGFDEFARRLADHHAAGAASFGPETPTPFAKLFDASKAGSNSFVVAGERTPTGAALIASDPHLGVQQPNLMLIVGFRSPSYAVVGLTFPGLPFAVIGRNERIAWGGTNMMGVSSALYDVSSIPPESMRVRKERIARRLWFAANVEIKETPLGPIVTDMPFLDDLGYPRAALWWRGHEPSDEPSTFMNVMRAEDWDQFRAAFQTYAVGGQNFLYADADGNIGQLLAFEYIPGASRATSTAAPAPIDDERFDVANRIPSTKLPAAYNPPQGFLVSANNTPIRLDPPATLGGNQNDRVLRLRQLLAGPQTLNTEHLKAAQADVRSLSSADAAAAIAARLEPGQFTIVDALRDWSGDYHPQAPEPVAYQRLARELLRRHYRPRFGSRIASFLRNSPAVHAFIAEDLATGAVTDEQLRDAAEAAQADHDPAVLWGDVHRLELAHPASRVPLIGDDYVFDEQGVGGTAGTVMKSAHAVDPNRHTVRFGAQSRHVSDLADLDANWFVLLGGQDGWFGSANQLDQWPLFKQNQYVRVPLRESTVRAEFRAARLDLRPTPPAGD